MTYQERYQQWLDDAGIDEGVKEELRLLKGDEKEIEDRFYQDLEFGTAGLRGVIGAGSNRINDYVVARVTHALAQVMKQEGEAFAKRGVAIAYDSRIKSDVFAEISARVMAANGVTSYLYDSLRSTPQLSFAVRYWNCGAGINVTASHNPKEYNGYKVYWQEGSQIKDDIADRVLAEIEKITSFGDVPIMDLEEAKAQGLIKMIGSETDEAFYKEVLNQTLREDIDKDVCIVYTPLYGTGNVPVREILNRRGFDNVHIVEEQVDPDGNFPTVTYPNPEEGAAFEYAIQLGKEVNADILIATDPDCDRLAVACQNTVGDYVILTGNQIGAILVNYILSTLDELGRMPKNPAIVKSIVTGEMCKPLCDKYGVELYNVLTGFKNIYALQNVWDVTKEKDFIMGFEESIGYAFGTFVRDKDAVTAAMLLAEAAGYYKNNNKNLLDVLFDLFEEYGYYQEVTTALTLEGIEGQRRIGRMMSEYRDRYLPEIDGSKLLRYRDYKALETVDIASSERTPLDSESTNALIFEHDDGCWYALRPSGTEPKIKIYVYAVAPTMREAQAKREILRQAVTNQLLSIE